MIGGGTRCDGLSCELVLTEIFWLQPAFQDGRNRFIPICSRVLTFVHISEAYKCHNGIHAQMTVSWLTYMSQYRVLSGIGAGRESATLAAYT